MHSKLEYIYPETFAHVNDGSTLIFYSAPMREFSVSTSNDSIVAYIKYCPWTGRKYPDSLRDRLFDELERLRIDGISYNVEKLAPDKFYSEEWWIEKGL